MTTEKSSDNLILKLPLSIRKQAFQALKNYSNSGFLKINIFTEAEMAFLAIFKKHQIEVAGKDEGSESTDTNSLDRALDFLIKKRKAIFFESIGDRDSLEGYTRINIDDSNTLEDRDQNEIDDSDKTTLFLTEKNAKQLKQEISLIQDVDSLEKAIGNFRESTSEDFHFDCFSQPEISFIRSVSENLAPNHKIFEELSLKIHEKYRAEIEKTGLDITLKSDLIVLGRLVLSCGDAIKLQDYYLSKKTSGSLKNDSNSSKDTTTTTETNTQTSLKVYSDTLPHIIKQQVSRALKNHRDPDALKINLFTENEQEFINDCRAKINTPQNNINRNQKTEKLENYVQQEITCRINVFLNWIKELFGATHYFSQAIYCELTFDFSNGIISFNEATTKKLKEKYASTGKGQDIDSSLKEALKKHENYDPITRTFSFEYVTESEVAFFYGYLVNSGVESKDSLREKIAEKEFQAIIENFPVINEGQPQDISLKKDSLLDIDKPFGKFTANYNQAITLKGFFSGNRSTISPLALSYSPNTTLNVSHPHLLKQQTSQALKNCTASEFKDLINLNIDFFTENEKHFIEIFENFITSGLANEGLSSIPTIETPLNLNELYNDFQEKLIHETDKRKQYFLQWAKGISKKHFVTARNPTLGQIYLDEKDLNNLKETLGLTQEENIDSLEKALNNPHNYYDLDPCTFIFDYLSQSEISFIEACTSGLPKDHKIFKDLIGKIFQKNTEGKKNIETNPKIAEAAIENHAPLGRLILSFDQAIECKNFYWLLNSENFSCLTKKTLKMSGLEIETSANNEFNRSPISQPTSTLSTTTTATTTTNTTTTNTSNSETSIYTLHS